MVIPRVLFRCNAHIWTLAEPMVKFQASKQEMLNYSLITLTDINCLFIDGGGHRQQHASIHKVIKRQSGKKEKRKKNHRFHLFIDVLCFVGSQLLGDAQRFQLRAAECHLKAPINGVRWVYWVGRFDPRIGYFTNPWRVQSQSLWGSYIPFCSRLLLLLGIVTSLRYFFIFGLGILLLNGYRHSLIVLLCLVWVKI